MRAVVILEDFTAYPGGKKTSFASGTEPSVPDAFADLIVAKGHARDKVTPPPAKADSKAPATKDASREVV